MSLLIEPGPDNESFGRDQLFLRINWGITEQESTQNCKYHPQLFNLGQLKMNKKYLNLVCEGIKYGMIDSSIIMDYLEKRL